MGWWEAAVREIGVGAGQVSVVSLFAAVRSVVFGANFEAVTGNSCSSGSVEGVLGALLGVVVGKSPVARCDAYDVT